MNIARTLTRFPTIISLLGVTLIVAGASFYSYIEDTARSRPYDSAIASNKSDFHSASTIMSGNVDWLVDASWTSAKTEGIEGVLEIRLRQRRGHPVSGVDISAIMVKSIEIAKPVSLQLTQRAPGLYSANAALPKRGVWDVYFSIERNHSRIESYSRLLVP